MMMVVLVNGITIGDVVVLVDKAGVFVIGLGH